MENQRVRITKEMIRQALIDLLQRKDIVDISVRELCAKAEVNRTTFYKYYGTPQDVLDEILNAYSNNIRQMFLQTPVVKGGRLIALLRYAQQNKLLSQLMFRTRGGMGAALSAQGATLMRELLPSGENGKAPSAELAYIHKFWIAGGSALISEWLDKPDPEPAEQIAALLADLYDYKPGRS